MRTPSGLILPALLLLASACSVPLLERAETTPGFSFTAGTGIATGRLISGHHGVGNIRPPILSYCVCPVGVVKLSRGMSPRLGFFLQAVAGPGFWLSQTDSSAGIPVLYDFRAGSKFAVGKRGAIRAGLGYPGVFDLEYLHDLNQSTTANAGIGLRGVSLGLCRKFSLSRSAAIICSGGAGFGWEHLYDDPRFIPVVSLGFAIETGPAR